MVVCGAGTDIMVRSPLLDPALRASILSSGNQALLKKRLPTKLIVFTTRLNGWDAHRRLRGVWTMKCSILTSLALAIACATGPLANAADWGNLKVKIVLAGDAPKVKPLTVDKDPAVCAAPGKKPINEELVVGKDGGVRDVVLMLVPEKGSKVSVHPDYEKTAKDTVVIDNKNCRFEPHVSLFRLGQSLELKNSDPVGHNSKVDFSKNAAINPILPAGGKFDVKPADVSELETRPTKITCSIHPWMSGWVVVQDHPYAAVSNEKGEIEIKNLPTGKWTFQLRHPDGGYVAATGGKETWSKQGKATIEIKSGDNDLGTLKMPVPKG